jgi:hypothetical protein
MHRVKEKRETVCFAQAVSAIRIHMKKKSEPKTDLWSLVVSTWSVLKFQQSFGVLAVDMLALVIAELFVFHPCHLHQRVADGVVCSK